MITTMFIFTAMFTTMAAPVFFVAPDELEQSKGVFVQAQIPDDGQVLLQPDEANPKLWYMPAGSWQDGNKVDVWYQRVNSAEKEFSDQRTLCMGILDSAGWHYPAIDNTSPVWGGPNNVVMRRSPHKPTWGGFNVFQIIGDDSLCRMLYWDQPDAEGKAGAMLAESENGLKWEKDDIGCVFTEPNDAFTLLETKNQYLLYQTKLEDWPDKPYPDNLDKKRRVISLRVSSDMKSWSDQKVCLRPDAQDKPETEFYLMKVFSHAGVYIGLIMKYYADPALPNKHSAIIKNELAYSRDGRSWLRPFRDVELGFWSYADPFILGGRFTFVTWKDKSMMTVSYPQNRLTAVVADSEGSFATKPFPWPEGGLSLDLDIREGWIEAELLREDGTRIPNISPVRFEKRNEPWLLLPWQLEANTECRIAFKLFKAKLYAVETKR